MQISLNLIGTELNASRDLHPNFVSFDVEITRDYVGMELEGVCGFSLFRRRPGIPINRPFPIIVGAPLYLWNPQRYGYSSGNGYCSVPAITLLRLSRYSIAT